MLLQRLNKICISKSFTSAFKQFSMLGDNIRKALRRLAIFPKLSLANFPKLYGKHE